MRGLCVLSGVDYGGPGQLDSTFQFKYSKKKALFACFFKLGRKIEVRLSYFIQFKVNLKSTCSLLFPNTFQRIEENFYNQLLHKGRKVLHQLSFTLLSIFFQWLVSLKGKNILLFALYIENF